MKHSLGVIAILTSKEMRDAWRNRWFLLFTAAFAVLALGLARLSLAGIESGFASLGRTAASLIQLVLLVAPLMGLTLGAASIAGERERGTFLYLLAQPAARWEIVMGKFLGLAAAVTVSVVAGFALAAVGIGRRAGVADLPAFLAFLGLTALLALASVSVGLLLSSLFTRASAATGTSLFVWLTLVLLGDAGLAGTSLALELAPRQLLALALLNPLNEFKLAAILELRGGLEVLGPAGLYATRTLGEALPWVLTGGLALWTVLPLALTVAVIQRRGAL